MRMLVRLGVVLAVLSTIACGGGEFTTNPAASDPPAVAPPPTTPPSKFPPQSGPSRTFEFDHELGHRVAEYTRSSRFVLYDNGAFVLQYPSLNQLKYAGGYRTENDTLRFVWEGWSVAGPWGATGTLKGDTLQVRFNPIMQLSDFDDAGYLRVR